MFFSDGFKTKAQREGSELQCVQRHALSTSWDLRNGDKNVTRPVADLFIYEWSNLPMEIYDWSGSLVNEASLSYKRSQKFEEISPEQGKAKLVRPTQENAEVLPAFRLDVVAQRSDHRVSDVLVHHCRQTETERNTDGATSQIVCPCVTVTTRRPRTDE